ncbi:MAG: DMT family transporter [Clostridia bacterium]
MKYKGYILLGITIILFSTLEVVTSTLKGIINPLQLTFIRFLIGGAVLLPLVIKRREKMQAKDLLFFLGLGILNMLISMGSLQLAISMGKASTAAILISSNPIFVLFFSSLLLKEKVTFERIACILLGVVGIILIIYRGNVGGDTAVSLTLGIIASILAVVFLGESLSLKTVAGMMLVLAGVAINFLNINFKTRESRDSI